MKMLAAGYRTTAGSACSFLHALFDFGAQFIVNQLAITPKVPTSHLSDLLALKRQFWNAPEINFWGTI